MSSRCAVMSPEEPAQATAPAVQAQPDASVSNALAKLAIAERPDDAWDLSPTAPPGTRVQRNFSMDLVDRSQEVTVIMSVPIPGTDRERRISINAFANERIADIKARVSNLEAFPVASGPANLLLLNDRELHDSEYVQQVLESVRGQPEGENGELHIIVRLRDLEELSINTDVREVRMNGHVGRGLLPGPPAPQPQPAGPEAIVPRARAASAIPQPPSMTSLLTAAERTAGGSPRTSATGLARPLPPALPDGSLSERASRPEALSLTGGAFTAPNALAMRRVNTVGEGLHRANLRMSEDTLVHLVMKRSVNKELEPREDGAGTFIITASDTREDISEKIRNAARHTVMMNSELGRPGCKRESRVSTADALNRTSSDAGEEFAPLDADAAAFAGRGSLSAKYGIEDVVEAVESGPVSPPPHVESAADLLVADVTDDEGHVVDAPVHPASCPLPISPATGGAGQRTTLAAHAGRSNGSDQILPVVPESFRQSGAAGTTPPLDTTLHPLNRAWREAQMGLDSGWRPELTPAGTGGTYFLSNASGQRVAVFKPMDEEPNAEANPKGWSMVPAGEGGSGSPTQALRLGLEVGQGALREVAAYLLDHNTFSDVPATHMVEYVSRANGGGGGGALVRKVGSLQEYAEHDGDCEEWGSGAVSTAEVHKIAVLDMRLANTDRNASNVLIRRLPSGQQELIPIDHGYCLPACFQDINFEWVWWPQAEQPFDDVTRAFVATLDAEKDLQLLKEALDWDVAKTRPGVARVMRVCTHALRAGAAAGLPPATIGGFMCRGYARSSELPSDLETLHVQALEACGFRAPPAKGDEACDMGLVVPEPEYLAAMLPLVDRWMQECADASMSTSTESSPSDPSRTCVFGPE
ncbi:unnamed protein product [Pedinophyceae sp. YPF-701]|nr:unnamed protein product [Pedinophyceae sp. YPF-701]